jgi:16S rRNA (guanine527-N7)-methyltransferase
VEQLYKDMLQRAGVTDAVKADKLIAYASLVHETNQKFNLTGFKTVEDIIKGLVIDSYRPVAALDVPRGTLFADIGSGSGVPGVVIGVIYPEAGGVLIDSNSKRMDFVNEVILSLGLANLQVVTSRVEDFSLDGANRERFDLCFTRAFGPLYYSAEFGLPVLKKGGSLYIYSKLNGYDLSDGLISHYLELGSRIASADERRKQGISPDEGLLWMKDHSTPCLYPRRFPIVKRAAEKIPETTLRLRSGAGGAGNNN